MTESEKFRTERLVARPWQIEDLPLAMELWGDPDLTALIDSRGKLTNARVGEKLRAEIERERSGGVKYQALFDHRNGEFVGCGRLRPVALYARRGEFRSRVPSREELLGQGFATEAAFGALEYAWEQLRLSQVYAGHHPRRTSC